VNWLDIVLIGIAAVSTLAGFARGLTRMVVGCGATLLALILSLGFYGIPGGFFEGLGMTRQLANFLGFIAVFAGVLIAGTLIAALLGKLLKLVGLSIMDRLAGGLLGFLRGAAIGVVIVMAMAAFAPKPPPAAVRNSRCAPYLIAAGGAVARFAPRELRDAFEKSRNKLEQAWRGVRHEVDRY